MSALYPAPSTSQGWERVFAPDAAGIVLDLRVRCAATGELLPAGDTCWSSCRTGCAGPAQTGPAR